MGSSLRPSVGLAREILNLQIYFPKVVEMFGDSAKYKAGPKRLGDILNSVEK